MSIHLHVIFISLETSFTPKTFQMCEILQNETSFLWGHSKAHNVHLNLFLAFCEAEKSCIKFAKLHCFDYWVSWVRYETVLLIPFFASSPRKIAMTFKIYNWASLPFICLFNPIFKIYLYFWWTKIFLEQKDSRTCNK